MGTGSPQCSWHSDKDRKKLDDAACQLTVDQHLLQTMVDYLLPCLEPPVINCRTEYTCPKGILYRAHPKYEAKAWYDHALVDWDDVALPARILSIVNLHYLKPNSNIKFPGRDMFIGESGLYIIIQSYNVIDTVAEKAAKLAAKEVSMHVSPPKKRRWKKRRLIPIAASATSAADAEELLEEKDPQFSWHVGYHFSRTPLIYLASTSSM